MNYMSGMTKKQSVTRVSNDSHQLTNALPSRLKTMENINNIMSH